MLRAGKCSDKRGIRLLAQCLSWRAHVNSVLSSRPAAESPNFYVIRAAGFQVADDLRKQVVPSMVVLSVTVGFIIRPVQVHTGIHPVITIRGLMSFNDVAAG